MSNSTPIRIPYAKLRSDPTSLKAAIEAGLGSQPGALGVVIIEGVLEQPSFFLRHSLILPSSS